MIKRYTNLQLLYTTQSYRCCVTGFKRRDKRKALRSRWTNDLHRQVCLSDDLLTFDLTCIVSDSRLGQGLRRRQCYEFAIFLRELILRKEVTGLATSRISLYCSTGGWRSNDLYLLCCDSSAISVLVIFWLIHNYYSTGYNYYSAWS